MKERRQFEKYHDFLNKRKLKQIRQNPNNNIKIENRTEPSVHNVNKQQKNVIQSYIAEIKKQMDLRNKNKEIFKNKNIIELGTGCGLLGISILKQIPAIGHYTFSDYQESVINNLKTNLIRNKLKENKKYDILKLDWRDYEKIDLKYDIILGSE